MMTALIILVALVAPTVALMTIAAIQLANAHNRNGGME